MVGINVKGYRSVLGKKRIRDSLGIYHDRKKEITKGMGGVGLPESCKQEE